MAPPEDFVYYLIAGGLIIFMTAFVLIIRSHSRSLKLQRISAFRQHDMSNIKKLLDSDRYIDLDIIIFELGAKQSDITEHDISGFIFIVPKDHAYSFLSKIRVVKIDRNSVKITASLKGSIPSNLNIRQRIDKKHTFHNEFSVKKLSNIFHFTSQSPEFWN
ncbi:MAG: hypothetical protein ACXABK_05865 [Candidatus Heimdallarchaeaceae archaeon]|jgi:hypothetical protein